MVVIMQISIHIKENYGVPTAYPICDKAKLFADLCGTKTLTVAALAKIARLGYDVLLEPTAYPAINKAIKKRNTAGEYA
jgi:hypothetical protein